MILWKKVTSSVRDMFSFFRVVEYLKFCDSEFYVTIHGLLEKSAFRDISKVDHDSPEELI
jgi:hypothetical protein